MPIFFTLLSLQASKTWKNKRPTISIKISSREPHHLCLSIPTIRDRSNTSNEPPSSKICLRTQLECRLDCQQHGQKRPFNAHFEAREEEIKNQTYKTTRLHCWYCDNKDQRSLGNALTEKKLTFAIGNFKKIALLMLPCPKTMWRLKESYRQAHSIWTTIFHHKKIRFYYHHCCPVVQEKNQHSSDKALSKNNGTVLLPCQQNIWTRVACSNGEYHYLMAAWTWRSLCKKRASAWTLGRWVPPPSPLSRQSRCSCPFHHSSLRHISNSRFAFALDHHVEALMEMGASSSKTTV